MTHETGVDEMTDAARAIETYHEHRDSYSNHWNAILKRDQRRIHEWYDGLPKYQRNPACINCDSKSVEVLHEDHKRLELHGCRISIERPGKMKHKCGLCKFEWTTQSLAAEIPEQTS